MQVKSWGYPTIPCEPVIIIKQITETNLRFSIFINICYIYKLGRIKLIEISDCVFLVDYLSRFYLYPFSWEVCIIIKFRDIAVGIKHNMDSIVIKRNVVDITDKFQNAILV